MDILKTVLMILFAIDCIVLTAIVLLQDWEQSAVLQKATGDRIKDVLWKALL